MTESDWDDDAILRETAAALREAGPLIQRVRAAGDAAYTWRGIDEELEFAVLTYDSLLEAGPAVRSAAPVSGRTMLFTGNVSAVQVERDGDLVVGQLIPPEPGRLTVETAAGYHAESAVDDVGCFSFAAQDGEVLRLRLQAGSIDLVTDWIRW